MAAKKKTGRPKDPMPPQGPKPKPKPKKRKPKLKKRRVKRPPRRKSDASVASDPDPVPFVKFRFRNNSTRRIKATVVVRSTETSPPTDHTVAIPTSGGWLSAGDVEDVTFGTPPLDVNRVFGTVMLENETEMTILGHSFDGGLLASFAGNSFIQTNSDTTTNAVYDVPLP